MVHDIHIFTQYQENYGTPEVPHWKMKGGRTVVLTGVKHSPTSTFFAEGQAAVESVRSQIERSNPMAKEWILDWEYAKPGSLTEYEQCQMKFEGRIVSSDDRIDLKEGS